jgi:hypothetical protein
MTSFSQHIKSRLSYGGATLSTAAEASCKYVNVTRTQPHDDRAIDVLAVAWQNSELSSSNHNDRLYNSDSEPSSEDYGCLSDNEQQRTSTSKQNRLSKVDEQHLLAQGKPWEWIFGKFPGRTRPAIRSCWNMVRPKGE